MELVQQLKAFIQVRRFYKNVRGQFDRGLSLGVDFGTNGERYVLWDPHRKKIVEWGKYEGEKQHRGARPSSQRHTTLKEWSKRLPRHKIHFVQVNVQDNSVSTGSLSVPPKNQADEATLVRLALKERLQAPLEEMTYFCRDEKPDAKPAQEVKPSADGKKTIAFGTASRDSVLI